MKGMMKEKRPQHILSWCQGRGTKIAAAYGEKNSLAKAGDCHSCDFENINSEKSWVGDRLPVWQAGQEDLNQSYPDLKGWGAWPRWGLSHITGQGRSFWWAVRVRRKCPEEGTPKKTEEGEGEDVLRSSKSEGREPRATHKLGIEPQKMENLS